MTGLVCDRKVPVRLKGCIHKAIVRPAMLYGMETAPLNKSMVKKMDMVEMKMLRWEIGLTREKIWNKVVRVKLGVREISAKVKKSCLQWYGHVRRREESYMGRSDGDRGSRKETREKVDGQHHRGYGRTLVEGEGHWGSGEMEKRISCGDPT